MAPGRRRFVCENCGATQSGWMGRCPECGEWNTMVETLVDSPSRSAASATPPAPVTLGAQAYPLAAIPPYSQSRIPVPMEELSRVLGGGIVPGSVILVSGDPGIGKSTLLLQLAALLGEGQGRVLYASGEESLQQIKMRADRLSMRAENLIVLSETNLAQLLGHIDQLRPNLAIIDSIQSIYTDELSASPGSVSQVRECATALHRQAKELGIATVLVGHVTKAGDIAGPRVLEHLVDAVLYLEGERFHSYRLLRGVKNRFGSTNEVGVFEMTDRGMTEVSNPSQVFLEERIDQATGSTVAVTMEGTRPILVEVQALVSPGIPERPRRTCNGVDLNRLLLLAAVLTRRVGLGLNDQDIFVNVVGGLHVQEPAVDLAVACAIASSYHNRPVLPGMAIFGEVGLVGELRSVGQSDRRIREAAKLGFTQVLMPRTRGGSSLAVGGTRPSFCRTLAEAIGQALAPPQ
ncbi:MAG: DNA repair protein RadA [Anaerolineae bacterium]|jgi:DNA repair protein RadA/Sms|nr:DNA repair protein RadA [Chloroflexota bacterium]